jgi:hypothetical protein
MKRPAAICSWRLTRCQAGDAKHHREGATRWVFIRIYNNKTAANARRFLRDLERACPLSGHCVAMPCRAVNGRIEDGLQSHHFRSGEEVETTLHRYAWLYNQQLPQSVLGSKTPLQEMKDWHKLKPKLFKIQSHYRPGCDA